MRTCGSNSGRVASVNVERDIGGSGACQGAPHKEGQERDVIEGNEKADELAKAGAMLDEGFMAEARAKTVQQESEVVYAASQYAVSFRCMVEEWKDCEEVKPKPKEKLNFVDKKREDTKHRTEWCTETYKCR